MKFTIVLSTIILSHFAFSQNSEYNSSSWKNPKWLIKGPSKRLIKDYKSVETIVTDSKGKISKQIDTYNEYGSRISSVVYKRNSDKIYSNHIAEYDQENRRIHTRYVRNGKLVHDTYTTYDGDNVKYEHENYGRGTYTNSYTYDSLNRRTSYTRIDRKTKQTQKSTWSYNPDSTLSSSKYFYKTKLSKTWKYSYYPDGQKKDSQLFNSKGELVRKWTYDCKPEGEELDLKKEERLICDLRTAEDGYLVDVQEEFRPNGSIHKTITKYNIADTTLAYSAYFSANGMYREEWFDGSYRKRKELKTYDQNGQVLYHTKTKFDGDLKLSEIETYKGEHRYKVTFQYNDLNRRISAVNYNADGEISAKTEYRYTEW